MCCGTDPAPIFAKSKQKHMQPTPIKCLPGDQPRILVSAEFIAKNNLSLSRSQGELLEKYNSRSGFLDFYGSVLLDFMELETAKPLLKEESVTDYESGKEKWAVVNTIEEAAQDFLDYMVFAWMKAEDQRGISATRSVQKLAAWLWVMGCDDLAAQVEDEGLYNPYGAPALIEVCTGMGIDVPESLREFASNPC